VRIIPTLKTLDNLQKLAISLIPEEVKNAPVPPPEEAPIAEELKRAARVRALIKAHYPPEQSGHSKAISHIAAAILGVDPAETLVTERVSSNKKIPIKKGTALMVIGNTMGHSYQIGRVVFAYENHEAVNNCVCLARFVRSSGETKEEFFETGNSLGLQGTTHDGNSRYATEAEIVAEIEAIKKITNDEATIGF